MLNNIKGFLPPFRAVTQMINDNVRGMRVYKDLCFTPIARDLTDKALHSVESGVSKESLCDKDVIVSLTSFGRRVYDVYLAIESIMQGSVKPNKFILWLSKDEFEREVLPVTLQNQRKRGLEIRFCEDFFSYKKIIPTLREYPNANVITIDDDLIYNYDFVENLVACHLKNPGCICAGRIHRITMNEDGTIRKYMDWDWEQGNGTEASALNFFTGCGGVLYPQAKSLHENVFDTSTFLGICKSADDVWLNAMARLQGTLVVKSFTHDLKGCDFVINPAVQDIGLSKTNNNVRKSQNDVQIKAVFEKYGITLK